jgi:hypothetical protein
LPLPDSWSEVLDRLAALLDGYYRVDKVEGGGRVEAEAWLREIVEARYGVTSLRDLPREIRAIVFQKTCGVLLLVEEEGVPLELFNGETGQVDGVVYRDGTIEYGETFGRRERIARAFARYFEGLTPEGPPWRVSDVEADRPSYEEWAKGAEFE